MISHLNKRNMPVNVDVSSKKNTKRSAKAEGKVAFSKKVFDKITKMQNKKGEIINVSILAGIIGAKKTSELIPLCHNISLENVDIHIKPIKKDSSLKVIADVKTFGKTGVEKFFNKQLIGIPGRREVEVSSIGKEIREVSSYIFKEVLILMHPFIPFVTEEIWLKNKLDKSNKNYLMYSNWITGNYKKGKEFKDVEKIINIISQIRSFKNELNVSPGSFIDISLSKINTNKKSF